jgi:CIC family chloride channel protein
MKNILNKLRSKDTLHFLRISLYAALVGVISGLGAVFFRLLIAFFHNLFFFGKFSFHYDSNLHFTSPFGVWVILIQVIGTLIMGFLIQKYAPEAKGHGVPEVIDAVINNKGRIRPIVSLVKIFATAIGIGAGESAGREGPIVQIGASFGSTLGQLLKLKPGDTILLVASGAAGGIAATFNAPIAGVLFAAELILPELSPRNFIPLVISSTVATRIAYIFTGTQPTFIVPGYTLKSSREYIAYFILGILSGFVAILFTKMLANVEIKFDKLHIPPSVKPAIGGLIVGALGYVLYLTSGHYYIFGVGYAFITDILTGKHMGLLIVIILIFAKIFATSFSLGSGGSGGILAPSLYVGAATGAAFGMIVHSLFPTITAPPAAYAIVGMAAVVSGTTGATLTAIVMAYELTRSYEIILPLMLGAVTSSFVVTFLYGYTMYSEPLWRRSIIYHGRRSLDLFSMIVIKDIALNDVGFVRLDDTVLKAKDIMKKYDISKVIVLNSKNAPIGIVRYIDIEDKNESESVEKFYVEKDISIPEDETLLKALHKMEKLGTDVLAVVDSEGKLTGVLPAGVLRDTYLRRRRGIL